MELRTDRFALNISLLCPYLRIEPSTVIRRAHFLNRQFGLQTWFIPKMSVSRAQVRFEWGLLEIHHIF
jgi:hypothetical protein